MTPWIKHDASLDHTRKVVDLFVSSSTFVMRCWWWLYHQDRDYVEIQWRLLTSLQSRRISPDHISWTLTEVLNVRSIMNTSKFDGVCSEQFNEFELMNLALTGLLMFAEILERRWISIQHNHTLSNLTTMPCTFSFRVSAMDIETSDIFSVVVFQFSAFTY